VKHLQRDASGAWHFDPYFAYLATIQARLTEHVYAFAGDWAHYALDSPQSLHDAWLEELVLTEAAPSKSPQDRTIQLTLRLLGPMHDRVHVLQYYGVLGYRLEAGMTAGGHGDVLVHEVRLNELGVLVHEILFAAGARIVIECADFRYEEHPLPPSRSGAA
jgi:hypothetical protein